MREELQNSQGVVRGTREAEVDATEGYEPRTGGVASRLLCEGVGHLPPSEPPTLAHVKATTKDGGG